MVKEQAQIRGIDRASLRIIALASLGGALEYYDLIIYGIFAGYIATTFFPSDQASLSLTLSLAVFAIGYFARPLGGLVLGHFGDQYGRKPVFVVSVLIMSGATAAIGLLPSFATWGVISPILLVLLRLVQGLCVWGEIPGAITYVVETAPNRRGLACGIVFCCVNTGVLLATLLNLCLHGAMTEPDIATYGWRVAFIVGGGIGLGSYWLRRSLEESPAFESVKSDRAQLPIRMLLRRQPWDVLSGICVVTATAAFNGLLFAHMPAYLTLTLGYEPAAVSLAHNAAIAILSAGLLLVAWLSDRISRRALLGFGALLLTICSYPIYSALVHKQVGLLPLMMCFGAAGAFVNGTFACVTAELFQTRTRFTGIAISLNLAFTIFGGTTPLAAAALIARSGDPVAPSFVLIGCALLTLVGALTARARG